MAGIQISILTTTDGVGVRGGAPASAAKNNKAAPTSPSRSPNAALKSQSKTLMELKLERRCAELETARSHQRQVIMKQQLDRQKQQTDQAVAQKAAEAAATAAIAAAKARHELDKIKENTVA